MEQPRRRGLANGKSPDAYRTISEVAEALDLPQHVLRFWETKFSQIRPMKRAGGRRYYRPSDVDLLARIKTLLYDDGYTIKGVQRVLRQGGAPDPALRLQATARRSEPKASAVVDEAPGPMAAQAERRIEDTCMAEPVAEPPVLEPAVQASKSEPEPMAPQPTPQETTAPALSQAARSELTAIRDELVMLRDLLRSKSGFDPVGECAAHP